MMTMTALAAPTQVAAPPHAPRLNTDYAAWLGRTALIAADFVHRRHDGMFALQVHLDAHADILTLDLLDQQGLIVYTQVVAGPPETLSVSWNGQSDGSRIIGPLRVRVSARNAGRTVPTITNVWTPVTAIDGPADRSVLRLITPNGPVVPDAVIRLA